MGTPVVLSARRRSAADLYCSLRVTLGLHPRLCHAVAPRLRGLAEDHGHDTVDKAAADARDLTTKVRGGSLSRDNTIAER